MTQLNPDQKPEAWSDIASHYEGSFEALTVQFAERLVSLLDLKRGERVIDIAAGTGAFSLLAARRGAQVLATDFAPGMVARLESRAVAESLTNVTAAVMDGQALEVADESFDVSVSVLGLIFFPDIQKGLREMKRVLRPGGRAAVVCWGNPDNFMLKTLVMRSVMTVVPEFQVPSEPPVWARLSGAEMVARTLDRAGFENSEVVTMTGRLPIHHPEHFWSNFVKSAPPLAYLFGQFDANRVAKIGEVFMDLVVRQSSNRVPELTAEACIGLGVA